MNNQLVKTQNSQIIATDRPSHETVSQWRPQGIRNLTSGLVERGKIKIGKKGEARKSQRGNTFQAPQKLDHFIVTTMDRGQDGNFVRDQEIMSMLGSAPKEIPITLIYDDIGLNFPTRYAMYKGKTLQCTGDGVDSKWRNDDGTFMLCQCPCPRQSPDYKGSDKCKINGTLSAIIRGADVVGGAWKFRTTSYNSVVGILSSLAMIKRITGGALAGIPLIMKLSPKSVANPLNGNQQTIYVVSIEYRGSVESLRDSGYSTLLEQQKHGVRVEYIESQARMLLSQDPDEYEEDSEDITGEFYPEARIDVDNSVPENNTATVQSVDVGDDFDDDVINVQHQTEQQQPVQQQTAHQHVQRKQQPQQDQTINQHQGSEHQFNQQTAYQDQHQQYSEYNDGFVQQENNKKLDNTTVTGNNTGLFTE